MMYKLSQFSRLTLAAGLLLLAALAGAQAPPSLFHYQGRLTNAAGTPITTTQTVYFSLIQGGSATDSTSGTVFYSERASVTPDSVGIFEFLVGSGTKISGTFDQSKFNTTQPVFLQVAVGSATNVLLPRARVTSVGYAFKSAQADTATTASFAAQSGTPRVSSVVDSTGGVTVIGDLIRINGVGLTGAAVTIGGRLARIKSQSDTQIVAQVPIGIPMGLNPVSIAAKSSGMASVTVAHVDVHRLLVMVNPQNSRGVSVIDAATQKVLVELSTVQIGLDTTIPNIQMAFANQGSLALVPTNTDGRLIAIDLTKNPPAVVGTLGVANTTKITAVSVSPDDDLIVVSDTPNNALRTVVLNESFPPYTTGLLGSNLDFFKDANGRNFRPSSFSQPRGSLFVNNGLFLVTSSNSGEVFAFRRNLTTNPNTFFFYRPFDTTNPYIINRVSAGTKPFSLRLTHDLTRVLVINRGGSNLLSFFLAPEGFGEPQSAAAAAGNALQLALGPLDDTAFTADSVNGDSNVDRIHVFNTAANSIVRVGDFEDFHTNLTTSLNYNPINPRNVFFQVAAIEPVEGELLAVGTDASVSGNNNLINLFTREGATISFLKNITMSSNVNGRVTYELEFQP